MFRSFHSLPKNKWTFEFESPELEVGHPFNDVWQIFNQGCLDPVTKKLREDCAINWKVIEMNLTQNTDVNFVERVDRSTRNVKVNYNEKALANCAFSMIPTFVVVTPPLSTSKGNTFEANEKTKWLGLDNELTAQLFDDVEDDGDKHSTAKLIDLTDSDDDLCDDESVSFSYDEFVTKGLWIDGQENACKTSPNHTNKWICASRHPSFGTKGI